MTDRERRDEDPPDLEELVRTLEDDVLPAAGVELAREDTEEVAAQIRRRMFDIREMVELGREMDRRMENHD